MVPRGTEQAIRAQHSVTNLLLRMSMVLIPLAGAMAGLTLRTLSGCHLATTIWTTVALVIVLLIGELQLVSQVRRLTVTPRSSLIESMHFTQ